MQQTEIVIGFSVRKELLIRTYKIDKPREKIRLYFTKNENQIFLHDYQDHIKKGSYFRNCLHQKKFL